MLGTLFVTGIYVLLNVGFLRSAPLGAIDGKIEVGVIAADGLFGDDTRAGEIVGFLIGIGLVSTVSAMVWAGSRVACVIGDDYQILRFLARRSRKGIPVSGVLWQAGIAIILLLTATFDQVLLAVGVVLALSSWIAVAGVFWLRWKEPGLPRPCRAWGYPFTPVLFLAVTGWMLVFAALDKPMETLAGFVFLAVGVVIYWISPRSAPDGASP
jgi:APA family basic amino acid/polyamine antiporter